MRRWRIWTHSNGDVKKIKIGWSWPAFLFTVPWLIYKRMWYPLLWLLPTYQIVAIAIAIFGKENLGLNSLDVFLLPFVLASTIFGLRGNKWYERSLRERYYQGSQLNYSGKSEKPDATGVLDSNFPMPKGFSLSSGVDARDIKDRFGQSKQLSLDFSAVASQQPHFDTPSTYEVDDEIVYLSTVEHPEPEEKNKQLRRTQPKAQARSNDPLELLTGGKLCFRNGIRKSYTRHPLIYGVAISLVIFGLVGLFQPYPESRNSAFEKPIPTTDEPVEPLSSSNVSGFASVEQNNFIGPVKAENDSTSASPGNSHQEVKIPNDTHSGNQSSESKYANWSTVIVTNVSNEEESGMKKDVEDKSVLNEGPLNLTSNISGLLHSATDTLATIVDETTATEALPELSYVNGKAEDLHAVYANIPISSQFRFSAAVDSNMNEFQQEATRALNKPGARKIVGTTVDTLKFNFENLNSIEHFADMSSGR